MATTSYTTRDFLNDVKALANGSATADITAKVLAYAESGIKKLDEKNEKRRNTLSPTQEKNEGIKSDILGILSDKPMKASELASELGISTQKVSALMSALVTDGKAVVSEIKEKGKSAVKGYSLPNE